MFREKVVMNGYSFNEELGRGGFGIVYKAQCLETQQLVAIKKISKIKIKKQNIENRIVEEINIHKELHHDNIVKLYTHFQDKKYIYLVLELCDGGTLDDYLKSERLTEEKGIKEETACYILKQIIDAVVYLQNKFVAHRDLSLRNILLTGKNPTVVKLADFGLSKEFHSPDDRTKSIVGTPIYMAPEVKEGCHSLKVDCYNIGIILYTLLVGKPPSDGKQPMDIIDVSTVKFPSHLSPEAEGLIKDLFRDDSIRPFAGELYDYDFFTKYGIKSPLSRPKYGSTGSVDSGYSRSASSSNSSPSYQNRLEGGRDFSVNGMRRAGKCRLPPRLETIQSSEYSHEESFGKSRNSCLDRNSAESRQSTRSFSPTVQKRSARSKSPSTRSLTRKSHGKPLLPEYPARCLSQERNINEVGVLNLPPACNSLPCSFKSNKLRSLPNHERSVSEERKRQIDAKCHSQNVHSSHYSSKKNAESFDNVRVDGSYQRSSSRQSKSKENQVDKCSDPNCRFTLSHLDRVGDSRCPPYSSSGNDNRSHDDAGFYSQPTNLMSQAHSCMTNYTPTETSLYAKPSKHQYLEQKTGPLNAIRLEPKRYPVKNVSVVSICANGQVIVELINKKQERCISSFCEISTDGMQISVYKAKFSNVPLGATPPSSTARGSHFLAPEHYSFRNVPKQHWKTYIMAKKVVDILRARTPKVIVYGKDAKCVMMENAPDPDFEMTYYDGGKVVMKDQLITISDKKGKTCMVETGHKLSKKSGEFCTMWTAFLNMKDRCIKLEELMKPLDTHDTFGESVFPLISGKVKLGRNTGKENSLPLSVASTNRMDSDVRSHRRDAIPCNSSCKYLEEPSLPSYKEAKLRDFVDILPNLLNEPKIVDQRLYVEYKDGFEMWASLKAEEVTFYDMKTRECSKVELKSKARSVLKPEYHRAIQEDLLGILAHVLKKSGAKGIT